MSGGGGGGGERGRAAHGLEPRDFRHTGLRLEWGHEHSADSFEVFALAVSRDGTTIAAGGASPHEPGVARIRVWRLDGGNTATDGDTDDRHGAARYARGGASGSGSRKSCSSSSGSAVLITVLKAAGAVAALSVALDASGSAVFAGMADGTLWGWDLPSGEVRFGGTFDHSQDSHPSLQRLPRRRRRARNPFSSAFARDAVNGIPEPRPIRRLVSFPGKTPSIHGADAEDTTYLVGVIGGHGIFPVWDGATGHAPAFDATVPTHFKDDPAWEEDGMCHIAFHPDGSRMFSTAVDAKSLRGWELRVCNPGVGGDGQRPKWRSEKLAVRNVYLAGLAALPRPSGERGSFCHHAQNRDSAPLLLATCAASLVPGTCYTTPDSPLLIVLVDARDGKEVRRFPLEGVTACNRFIDCSSLTSGGGGTLLFLAHKDGSVWIHGASNGAQIAALHDHANGPGTSGHHRLLPACVGKSPVDEEFLFVATTDGQCAHRWQVGVPSTWTRRTHKRFPTAFKEAVKTLALCASATWKQAKTASGKRHGKAHDWSGHGAACDPGESVELASGPGVRGEAFGSSGSGRTPALWGEGFARLVSVEPAILELVVARVAKLAHGSDVREG